MALAVRYTVIDGDIVHEDRGGVGKNYVPDTLGSTTKFTYVGTLGYCGITGSQMTYVRARMVMASRGRWATVDLLWPTLHAYAYCDDDPAKNVDPSGAWWVRFHGCSKSEIARLVNVFNNLLYNAIEALANCLEGLCPAGTPGCLEKLRDSQPPTPTLDLTCSHNCGKNDCGSGGTDMTGKRWVTICFPQPEGCGRLRCVSLLMN